MKSFLFLNADQFFKRYCPGVKSHKYKIRGSNTRGNPVAFSAAEILAIKHGLKQMETDIINELLTQS